MLFNDAPKLKDCGRDLTQGLNVTQLKVAGNKYSFQITVNGFNQALTFPLLKSEYFNDQFGLKAEVLKESRSLEIIPNLQTHYIDVSVFPINDFKTIVNAKTKIAQVMDLPMFVQSKLTFNSETNQINAKLLHNYNGFAQLDTMFSVDTSTELNVPKKIHGQFSARLPPVRLASHFTYDIKSNHLSYLLYSMFKYRNFNFEFQYVPKDKKIISTVKGSPCKDVNVHLGFEKADSMYFVADAKYKFKSYKFEVAADTEKFMKVSVDKQITDEFNLKLTAAKDLKFEFPIKFGLYMTFSQ